MAQEEALHMRRRRHHPAQRPAVAGDHLAVLSGAVAEQQGVEAEPIGKDRDIGRVHPGGCMPQAWSQPLLAMHGDAQGRTLLVGAVAGG